MCIHIFFQFLVGDQEWILGKNCFGGYIKTAFDGESRKNVDKAKADCAEACDELTKCQYGVFYWTSGRQVCYLHNEKCVEQNKDGKFGDHWSYRVYVKQ